MNLDDLKKLVDGSPDVLIKWAEENNIDFSGLDKDIAKTFVKERFNLSEEQFRAADFVFWISYYIEREAEDLIIEPEVHIGARRESIELMVSKLYFGAKIELIEKLYSSSKDPFIKLMRKVQTLRNDVAHGRLNNLEYGGFPLHDNRGKIKMIGDLRDSLRRKAVA